MKNPELELKKLLYDRIGDTINSDAGVFTYTQQPVSSESAPEKYIWLSTVMGLDNGGKDCIVTDITCEFTIAVRVGQNYNSTLAVEQGKEAIMELLVNKDGDIIGTDFKFINPLFESTIPGSDHIGQQMYKWCKLNLRYTSTAI